jgi:hypothetical protein
MNFGCYKNTKRWRELMKRCILIILISMTFGLSFLTTISGDTADYNIDPVNPKVSVIKGKTAHGQFALINTNNETIHGVLQENQFRCGGQCPLIEITSSRSFVLSPNGSTTIDFKIISKWFNEAQKLTFSISVTTFDHEDSSIDIIVFVKHNYALYSICISVPILFLIGLCLIIIRLRRKKH